MTDGLHIVALSGGKDSTALALRLAEVEPRDYVYICTPTGDELPDMIAHWERLEEMLGQPIRRLTGDHDLHGLIEHFKALPTWRMRWCTRILKIQAAEAFYLRHPGSVAYVGLRADEPERDGGIYDEAVIKQRYPLREWGWTVADVWQYLDCRGVKMPRRTDCARCYDQRLSEWWELWKEHPEIYAHAEAQEAKFGHTFRSDRRDTWPAGLKELRERFESGDVPRGAEIQLSLFGVERERACRVCSL
jgi:hypothetical protein